MTGTRGRPGLRGTGLGAVLLLVPVLAGCSAVDDALGLGAAPAPDQRLRALPAGDHVEAVVVDLSPPAWDESGPDVLSGAFDRCGSVAGGFEAHSGDVPPPYELETGQAVTGWASASVRVLDPAPPGTPADATARVVPNDWGPAVTLQGEVELSRDGAVFTAEGYPRLMITFTCR